MAVAIVNGLTFAYGSGPPVLDGISLELADGEHVALLGPSGSGKSTLLRAFAGLVPHFHGGVFAGSVVVGGQDTREAQPAQLVGTVASVFQDPEDQLVMSRVANEVAFGLENLGIEPEEIWPRVGEALELVGVERLAERPVGELSGGELQRVCLASALALRPRLLLLDEPTSQLDPEAADAFFDLVEGLPCAVLVSEQVDQSAHRRNERPGEGGQSACSLTTYLRVSVPAALYQRGQSTFVSVLRNVTDLGRAVREIEDNYKRLRAADVPCRRGASRRPEAQPRRISVN